MGRDQPSSLPAIWQVPHVRNLQFTGREELLEALHGTSTEAQPVVLTQVLRGLGGIGKTQLALEYAYRYGGRYRLVWWVRAETPETLATDYAALAAPLDLPQQGAPDQHVTIAAVRQWLEHHPGWLLILDNAPVPSAIRPYLPRTTHGHLLITSRHVFGWEGTAQPLTVPVLPRAEAVKLLLDVTRQADEDAARAIAETLGDLPLALAQAVAYVDATGLRLSAYVQRLQTDLAALLSRGEASPDYPGTVATTWAMAFAALQEQEAHLAALSLLKLCAFFAPEDIPYALVREGASALPAPLNEMVTDDFQWEDALVALRHYALIEVGAESLAVHRLVQAITRDRLSVEEHTQWAAAAMHCIAALFPAGNAADDPRTWPLHTRLSPHASSALSHIGEMDPAKVDTTLLLRMGYYLNA